MVSIYRPLSYGPCVSPPGATGASWTMKGRRHESCRNFVELGLNSTRIAAAEQFTERWCKRRKGGCQSMRDVVRSFAAPRHGAKVGRHPHCAAPAHPSAEDLHNRAGLPVVNLVFLGDSINFRVLSAAACDLLARGGAVEMRIPKKFTEGYTYKELHNHSKFGALKRYTRATYGEGSSSDLETISERHFLLSLRGDAPKTDVETNELRAVTINAATSAEHSMRDLGTPSNSSSERQLVQVRVIGLWRSFSALHGPGLVGEPAMANQDASFGPDGEKNEDEWGGMLSVFDDLFDYFGGCTAVLFNDGLHHHNTYGP